MSRRFCFTLDLKDDPALIAEYRTPVSKILAPARIVLRFCLFKCF
jgi:hypothetical protein